MTKTDKYIWAIAIVQFIPTLLFPPSVLAGAKVTVLIAPLVLFGLLGWGLVRRRPWALMLSIFVQGFNVIIRILMLLPRIVGPNGSFDVLWVLTSLIAAVLSTAILLQLEKPNIQIAVKA